MRWNYLNFKVDDLRGSTLADYLVNIEADFEIVEAGKIVYSEPAFPVAELARELIQWVSKSEWEAEDFLLESMSFEDPGAVRIMRYGDGWRVSSSFTPQNASSPHRWRELAAVITEFIEQVRRDLLRMEIHADFVLGTPT